MPMTWRRAASASAWRPRSSARGCWTPWRAWRGLGFLSRPSPLERRISCGGVDERPFNSHEEHHAMTRSLTGLAFATLLAASAHAAEPGKSKTSAAEVKKQAAEAVEATGRYVSEHKDEYAA